MPQRSIINDPLGYSLDARNAFAPGDVSRILGVSERKVRMWLEQKVVIPTMPSRGRGRPRLFSKSDVLQLAIVVRLERAGIIPQYLVKYLDAYRLACDERAGFRAKEVGARRRGRDVGAVDFASPNLIGFEFTTAEGERGVCVAQFVDVGPGFAEYQGEGERTRSERLIERLMANSLCLIINLRSLDSDLGDRIERYLNSLGAEQVQ